MSRGAGAVCAASPVNAPLRIECAVDRKGAQPDVPVGGQPITAPTGVCDRLLAVFHEAAQRVPAYRAILAEAGVRPDEIKTFADFQARVPILDKKGTFGRFGIDELCLDGRLGRPHFLLPSSGQGGMFSYGVYSPSQALEARERVDAALDAVIGVKRQSTLLINFLPMGVKVPTAACTVVEVSVRPDMVTATVRKFASNFDQLLLASDAAIVKRVLELGREQGIPWNKLRTHILVGGEMLAENARTYLGSFLDTDLVTPRRGLVTSSMGTAELGLNLFSEIPIGSGHPPAELIRMRRALHGDRSLLESVAGAGSRAAPLVVTYDPRSLFVEILPDQSLVLTPLEPGRVIPLVRYYAGDRASFPNLTPDNASRLQKAAGIASNVLAEVPIILIHGRGTGVRCGEALVTPEQIKEGLYAEPSLVPLITCNFRLAAARERAVVRLQLSPGVASEPRLGQRFEQAIAPFVAAPVSVECVGHLDFKEGIGADYERKFAYLDAG
jgi:phenylacetate-CoA ligase